MDWSALNLHVSGLRSGLQSRFVLSPLPSTTRPWQLVYLQSGSLLVQMADDPGEVPPMEFVAPAIVSWPAEPLRQVVLPAGSAGIHLTVADSFLNGVLGNRPETSEVRDMTRGFTSLPLDDLPDQGTRLTQALSEIAMELEAAASGHVVVIEAQLRCVLIYLWRQSYKTSETSAAYGPQAILLRRFRQLVEIHYRQRWKVADYASALNTTSDRLHNIATQVLNRTPLNLIHDRSHHEARALLTRTNMSLDQIAAHLNFKTTPQFSSFFRKLEGVPPGKYRMTAAQNKADPVTAKEEEFSDWP
jgi:AraC family transcriptional activator of pobA